MLYSQRVLPVPVLTLGSEGLAIFLQIPSDCGQRAMSIFTKNIRERNSGLFIATIEFILKNKCYNAFKQELWLIMVSLYTDRT